MKQSLKWKDIEMQFSQETWTSVSSIKLIWALLSKSAPSKYCATRNKNWKDEQEKESCFFLSSVYWSRLKIRHILYFLYGFTLYTYFIVDDSIFQLSEKVSTFSERYDSPEGKEGHVGSHVFLSVLHKTKVFFLQQNTGKGWS